MTPPRPTKEAEDKRDTVVGVKLTTAELERIDAAVALMEIAIPGVTRSSVLRAALKEGLDVIEERYSAKKPTKKR